MKSSRVRLVACVCARASWDARHMRLWFRIPTPIWHLPEKPYVCLICIIQKPHFIVQATCVLCRPRRAHFWESPVRTEKSTYKRMMMIWCPCAVLRPRSMLLWLWFTFNNQSPLICAARCRSIAFRRASFAIFLFGLYGKPVVRFEEIVGIAFVRPSTVWQYRINACRNTIPYDKTEYRRDPAIDLFSRLAKESFSVLIKWLRRHWLRDNYIYQ